MSSATIVYRSETPRRAKMPHFLCDEFWTDNPNLTVTKSLAECYDDVVAGEVAEFMRSQSEAHSKPELPAVMSLDAALELNRLFIKAEAARRHARGLADCPARFLSLPEGIECEPLTAEEHVHLLLGGELPINEKYRKYTATEFRQVQAVRQGLFWTLDGRLINARSRKPFCRTARGRLAAAA